MYSSSVKVEYIARITVANEFITKTPNLAADNEHHVMRGTSECPLYLC